MDPGCCCHGGMDVVTVDVLVVSTNNREAAEVGRRGAACLLGPRHAVPAAPDAQE